MQVDKLAKELETQQKKKATLEARASEAEKKISELNLKLADVSSLFVRILEWQKAFYYFPILIQGILFTISKSFNGPFTFMFCLYLITVWYHVLMDPQKLCICLPVYVCMTSAA